MIQSIYSVLRNWAKRAFLLCWQTVPMPPDLDLPCLSAVWERRLIPFFAEHTNHRIIVATFASNVDRVQQVVNTAYKYGRKVVVEGRSMVTIIDIASELGYINIPEGTLIDIDQLKNYPPESTVLITTGSQGESMAALSRMAASIHKKVSIVPGDVVVLSSTQSQEMKRLWQM